MRRLLHRWFEALGEHIARHGWVDPTGAALPSLPERSNDDEAETERVPQPTH